jgi:predicted small lipoprotein YifL
MSELFGSTRNALVRCLTGEGISLVLIFSVSSLGRRGPLYAGELPPDPRALSLSAWAHPHA